MILQIRRCDIRGGLGKGAELRRRHRHRTAAPKRVFQCDPRFAAKRRRQGVQCSSVPDFVGTSQLQVILQVLPDAGRVVNGFDIVGSQQVARSDSRQLQDMGRSDRTRRKYDFGIRPRGFQIGSLTILHANSSAALKYNALDMGMGFDPQSVASADGAQKALAVFQRHPFR